MRELLAAARQLYGTKKGELETLTMRFANGEISLPGDSNAEGADGADEAEGEGAAGDAAEGVGTDDREKSLGLAIGRAPDGAKPTGGLIEPPAGARRRVTKGAGHEPPSPGGISDVPEVMDRHEVTPPLPSSLIFIRTLTVGVPARPPPPSPPPLASPPSPPSPRHLRHPWPVARGPLSFPLTAESRCFEARGALLSALTRPAAYTPPIGASYSNAWEPATSPPPRRLPPPRLSDLPPAFHLRPPPPPHTNPNPRRASS